MITVEDCIEVLAGIQKQNGEFKLERSDYNLITSLARQTFRGIGFTDRQHVLAKEKILYYKTQFDNNGYDIDVAIDNTRLEIRKIDRSRWVRVVDKHNLAQQSHDEGPWIAIRFIFQKKLISNITNIKNKIGDGVYDKESKIHYFPLTENSVYHIISNFNEENNFDVQEELKHYYGKLEYMKNNKDKFVPGIYNLTLKNLHQKGLEYAISTIGEPDIDNLCHYYDQKERFGLHHFDDEDLERSLNSLSVLSKKIVLRQKTNILVNSTEYTRSNLVESVLELYRFPLLIVLNENTCYDELVEYYKAFSGIILNESCSVLFRLDNNEGAEFNNFIRQKGLNNPVDNSTKIVYISSSKIPKPLLKSDWTPVTAITNYSGRQYGSDKIDSLLNELDLVIHYDSDISPWKRKIIEKI